MKDLKHVKRFNESDENLNVSDVSDISSNKKLSERIKSKIKASFENTVLCARTNSPQESYQYAEKMANYIIRIIEGE
jgi:hypothetical protein